MTADDRATRPDAGGTQGDPLRRAMDQMGQEGQQVGEQPTDADDAQSPEDDAPKG